MRSCALTGCTAQAMGAVGRQAAAWAQLENLAATTHADDAAFLRCVAPGPWAGPPGACLPRPTVQTVARDGTEMEDGQCTHAGPGGGTAGAAGPVGAVGRSARSFAGQPGPYAVGATVVAWWHRLIGTPPRRRSACCRGQRDVRGGGGGDHRCPGGGGGRPPRLGRPLGAAGRGAEPFARTWAAATAVTAAVPARAGVVAPVPLARYRGTLLVPAWAPGSLTCP
jgi:hypothetical protein